MSYFRRMAYMGLGALLVLALIVSGIAVFAQEGDTPPAGEEAAQDEPSALEQDDARPDSDGPPFTFRNGRAHLYNGGELLAEALGITVEELQAAKEVARAAAIEQAVQEGLITAEQAEQLRERSFGFWPGARFDIDRDQLLANALGISVQELEAARSQVRETRLAALVDAGRLTREEADLLLARAAVRDYIDRDALAEMIQNAYESAVAQALADGAITQAQADQLLERLSNLDFGFDGFGPGPRFRGPGLHHGGPHQGGPGSFAPRNDIEAPALGTPPDA